MIMVLGKEKQLENVHSGEQPLYAFRIFKKDGSVWFESYCSKKAAISSKGDNVLNRDKILIQCIPENEQLLIENNFKGYEPYMRG